MSSSDVCRYCHSDIQLHMSGVTFAQLRTLVDYSLKFARMVESEDSYEFRRSSYWQKILTDVYTDYTQAFPNNEPVKYTLRTFHDED